MTRSVPRPGELEILACQMLGRDRAVAPLPRSRGRGARAALVEVISEALARGPCFVSFSGGRDSSLILALATHAARQGGLPLPVPVIMRFPDAADTEESAFQEAVLEHLRLPHVEVLELRDELDALGHAARAVLERHGVLWPGNAYMHQPVFELAGGGTVLTGIGGDELFGTRAPRRSPHRFLAAVLIPRGARRMWQVRQSSTESYHWLTPAARERVLRALADEELACPYPWDGAMGFWYESRAYGATRGAVATIGESAGCEVLSPLLDPRVLVELAVDGGPRGFASRAQAMRSLVGDLLPTGATERAGKASFGGAVWGPEARRFAATWDGSGLDERDVDVPALKRELAKPSPDFRTILLLHQAWHESAARRA